jgi:hypothetical protein
MTIIQGYQAASLPTLWISGLTVSNDATTPNTKLNVSAGIARDSNNVMDLTVGSTNTNFEGGYVVSPLVLDATTTGVNGLDTGSLGASSVYAVFLIGDSSFQQTTGVIATLANLASGSAPSPLMPAGYDSQRLIGYAVTNGSSNFLLMNVAGTAHERIFRYDAPIATAITAGNATTYTAVNLRAFVPNVNNLPVALNFAFTPGAASRTLNFTPGNGVGDAILITGQVTSVVVSDQVMVFAQPTTISSVSTPTVDYKVSNSGDAVAVLVAGFTFFL